MTQPAPDFDFSQLSVPERLELIDRIRDSIDSDQPERVLCDQTTAKNQPVVHNAEHSTSPEDANDVIRRLAGTWSQEDFDEFMDATSSLRQIDEELWQ